MLNDSVVDLIVRPNDDINGTEFIEFRVGDSVDFSEQIYTSNIFFSPVVDAPSRSCSRYKMTRITRI